MRLEESNTDKVIVLKSLMEVILALFYMHLKTNKKSKCNKKIYRSKYMEKTFPKKMIKRKKNVANLTRICS